MKDFSIIIVSFNTRDILCRCLDTLKTCIEDYDHEIIVVDNGSHDGTQKVLRKRYPEVDLIENDANLGFARAVNIGLKRAGGRILGLINSDIIFIEDVFRVLRKTFSKRPDIGLIGCRLLNEDLTIQKSAYWSYPGLLEEIIEYGNLSDFARRFRFPIRYSLSLEEHHEDREVAHLKGACLFFRRDIIEKIGYLDERFFMYREETDYCKRIHDAGYAVYFLASANVIHLHKVSSEKLADKGIRFRLKSHYQYLFKHKGPVEASFLYAIIIVVSTCRYIVDRLKGKDGLYYSMILKWHLGIRNT